MDTLMTYAQENSSSGSGVSFIWSVAQIVGLWMMFQKAGEPGWAAIIPFYNEYKLCEKTMGNPWYWLRLFVFVVPIIGWIAGFYFMFQIGKATARSYGQPESWAWGYTFLAPVFYCITGFGQYSYYGVMGMGDTRTGEARGAKTVDFDVTKNPEPVVTPVEPVVTPVEPVVTPVEPKAEESDVDFSFDQDENIE